MRAKIPAEILARQRNPGGPAFYCPFCHRLVISPRNLLVETSLCPLCAGMERHRVLRFLYEDRISASARESGGGRLSVLHIAPENSLYKFLSTLPLDYLGADLEPENFPFIPAGGIVKEDVLQLSFPDASFDFVLHNHVMEHVDDDIAFLKESLRVLRKGGSCIFSFPHFPDQTSLFDSSITEPEERKRLYGWHDHLRRYGHDFLDHFHEHGLFPEVLFISGRPCPEFTDDERLRMRLDAHDPADCILCLKKA